VLFQTTPEKSKVEGGGMKDESVVISVEWIKHAFILHPSALLFMQFGKLAFA
jgi:hypothetical protein